MSTTIDQRVVEMRFDNQHFEKNVSTTMSTLEKLKQKLNLSGASKGLENVNSAAKRVDMNGLANGVETVRARFSALEVMGVTALANITNSAVNAGKRMVKALTIDPVMTGFNEYETKINAIQTIMSNTASKGTTMDDVTRVINELNTYADKTIYNFAEMTRNIGTFTAAGVGLEDSAAAIQGIANLAAASGSNSQQASTAMYQLSQALASGTVKLMDWNSVVNAGMGGEKFQLALKSTAKEMGIAVDETVSFRDSLQDGWITADVLNKTLQKFTTEGAKEYADAMVASGKYTKEQADALVKEAQSMEDAATKVKTFTQLWSTMQESVQSGWAQTWELIVGDFEEAKEVLSKVSAVFSGIIDRISDARNTFLGGALDLSKPWSAIMDKLSGSGIAKVSEKIQDVSEKVQNVTKSLTDFQNIVSEVWYGTHGNGSERVNKLTEMGWDPRVVQDLVNKGSRYKLTIEDVEKAHAKFGLTMEETAKTAEKTAETTEEVKVAFENLSDEELRNAGLTEAEIKLYHDLAEEAKRSGKSMGELVDEMSKADGRTMIINSIRNAWKGLVGVFKAVRNAWVDIFPPMSFVTLYNALKSVEDFSKNLKLTSGEIVKLTKIFRGLFAAIDIVATLFGGGLKIAFNIFKDLLEALDMDILDFLVEVSDVIVAIRDWIDKTIDFTEVFKAIIPVIRTAVETIVKWFNCLKESEFVQNLISNLLNGMRVAYETIVPIIQKAAQVIKEWFDQLKNSQLAQDIIDGLANGLKAGVEAIWNAALELGRKIIDGLKSALDSHSPSKETEKVGKDAVQGLINGIVGFVKKVFAAVVELGKSVIDGIKSIFSKIDFGQIFALLAGGTLLSSIAKIGKLIDGLADVFDGFGDMMTNAAKVLKGFFKVLKAKAFSIRASAIKEIAIAIAILAGSLIALTFVDSTKLQKVSIILGIFTGGLLALLGLVDIFGKGGLTGSLKALTNVTKLSTVLIGISLSLILFAAAMKMLAGIEGDMDKAIVSIILFGAIISGLLLISKDVVGIDHLASVMSKLGICMLLLAVTMKIIAGMEWSEIGKAAIGMTGLGLLISGLIKATNKSGPGIEHAGITIRQMATAMLLLTIAAKIIAGMEWPEMGKAAIGLAGLVLVIKALTKATNLAGNGVELANASKMLIGMGICMFLLGAVSKIIAKMTWADMGKAAIGLIGLAGIITGLVYATNLADGGDKLKRVSFTLLTMSIAIGVLAGIAVLLGYVNTYNLIKGEIAVAALGGLIAVMIRATKGAQNVKGSLIAISVAIGILATAAIILSFVPTEKLAKATAALSIMLLSFAALTSSMKSLKKVKIGPLITMIAVIAILSGIVILLSYIDCSNVIPTVTALSILLMSLSASMLILSKAGPMTAKAIVPAMLMGVVVAELAVILGILSSKITNVDALIPTAISLSILLVALAAACKILAPIGATGPAALKGALTLAGVVAILGLVAIAIGEVMSWIPQSKIEEWKQGIDKFMDLLKSLASGLGEAIGAFVGGIAAGVLETVGQGLSDFMTNAQDFIDGAKTVDGSVLKGTGILAASILALTAADFVNGIANIMPGTLSLSQLGSELSAFMDGSEGFISGAKNIDPAMADGIKSLASAILILTAADIVNGITRIFGMDSSLAVFGAELAAFGPGLKAFSDSVDGINTEAVSTAAEAAKSLAEMANNIPNSGGWLANIFGDNDVETFGSQLKGLGQGLSDFSGACESLVVDNVNKGVDAANKLTGIAESIPNSGGALAALFGDNDFATFGSQLKAFGDSLASFSSSCESIVVENIQKGVDAGTKLAGLAESIPNSGGLLSVLFNGDNDFVTFGAQLVTFGASLVSYSNTTTGINTENIDASVSAAKSLVGLAEALPESGGIWSIFSADNDMSTFGSEIKKFGTAMFDYSNSVSGIDSAAISNSITNANRMVTLTNSLASMDTSGVKSFKDAISELGTVSLESIREAFSGGIPDIQGICNQLVSAISTTFSGATSTMSTAGTQMIVSLASGISSAADVVITIIDVTALIALTSFMSKTPMFMDVGGSLITALANGILNRGVLASAAIRLVVLSAANTARGGYSGFYDAGYYCVLGFANGIALNSWIAAQAAAAMANQAANAAKAALQQNSPSKVFYNIGAGTGEGFVNAMVDYQSIVYKAGGEMASYATKGFSNAISKLNDTVETGIDTQPTIRPVVDLTSVQNGINTINGLFANRSLALADINTSFTTDTDRLSDIISQIQDMNDTSNSEVVQMISDLRGDFGDLVKAIASLKLYLNGDTVVGELIGKIDKGLGQIATHKGRGN